MLRETRAASHCLRNKPTGSTTNWDGLKTKFMNKYFPPARTAKKMEKINNFQQEPDENLYQALERFKELLMKCPQHYLTEMQEKWHNGTSRSRSTKTSNELAAIQAQLNNLGRKIKKVNKKVYAPQVGYEQYKRPHYTKDFPLKEEGKTLKEAYYTLMGETLVLNRSLDPFFENYIKLNDLNEPFELRINQGNDLMPTIKEGEDKMEYKGNNVVETLMNMPIFVGTFSILIDFAVLENIDAYCDEGMGDVIFGEPFLREVWINAKRFDGMITIHNGNNEVTYQMVRSHMRFKHHTNEQCNKIPPLLKVSDEDKMNEISHPYQKLKGFYKGVLDLGLDYIRDAKMEEWLTRGHISVHEMK
uniref:Retrotransposon gag domain-containing protein n=1 Tax=Tanacetum cinerariifolium TaxID=118510 RepID=A0A699HQ32_TANCI|nr:hypothetical protein [Tanacetum cinerariifolium]